ncbi:DMT family transporter [Sedimenticola sp.]|uniref:DMT family transporter n=1 Tax=Sedimenticola sp. TaxID=1940285 RepID=UPI003D110BB8
MMSSMGIFANQIEQTHPANIVFLRFFFCTLSFPLIALLAYPAFAQATRDKLTETIGFARNHTSLWIVVGISMALVVALYTLGAVLLSVGLSVILLYTAAIWFPLVEKLACRFLFHDLRPTQFSRAYYLSVSCNLMGLVTIILGTTQLPNFGAPSSILGLIAAVTASMAFSFSMVLVRVIKAKGIKTEQMIISSSFIGSLIMFPALFVLPIEISIGNLYNAFGMGFIATALGGLVYFKGFGSVRTTLAPVLAYLEPIFGFSLAILILSERFTPTLLLGMAIILATNVGYTLLDLWRSRHLLAELD